MGVLEVDRGNAGPRPLGDRVGRHRVGARDDERELLAPEPGGDVAAAHRLAQRRADVAQDPIAVGMAVELVYGLEVVEVEGHQRERLVALVGALELEREPLVKAAVVDQPGERVGGREALQARLVAAQTEHQHHGHHDACEPERDDRGARQLARGDQHGTHPEQPAGERRGNQDPRSRGNALD